MPKKIKIAEKTSDSCLNLALDTINIGKQSIVFVNTKRSAERTAEEIAKKIKSGDKELIRLSGEILNVLSRPTKQCERLSRCMKKGIAFHHAGLTHKQKDIIEDGFRNRKIKIICATTSLAYGVDLPAYRTFLRDLKRYGHRGLAWIPVLEAHQMFGRAGRPKYDSEGQAVCIAATESDKKKINEKYINGEVEQINSKLAVEPVLRTYLLSLISANFMNTKKEIMNFFEKTFWAHQYKDTAKIELIIEKMLNLLEEWEFIKSTKEDFKSAADLSDEKYKATMIGKRIAELYIDPLTANSMVTCLRKASGMKPKSFSFLQMISHTLEIRPLLRARVKEHDKIQEALLKYNNYLLENEPSMYEPEYEEFIASVKTALMLHDWINEKDEDFLLEEYNIRPGELRVKLNIANWLLYSAEELTRMMQFRPLLKEILKLKMRLKHGVKEELLYLLQLKQVGRIRARRLYFNEIKNIADVKKADFMKLKQILGESTALKVKKQVGQEIKEVPKGKRKGQVSLSDW